MLLKKKSHVRILDADLRYRVRVIHFPHLRVVSVIVVSGNPSVAQILLPWARASVIVGIHGGCHVQIGRASPAGVHVVVKRATLPEQSFLFIVLVIREMVRNIFQNYSITSE